MRILRALPRALRYPREILVLMSDITLGLGRADRRWRHVLRGRLHLLLHRDRGRAGGFNGLQQIGAEAFTGVITALANTREITPLVAGVALAAQVGAGFHGAARRHAHFR